MKPFARIILVSTLALAAGCVSTLKVDNAPVAALDLNRYLGEWYEIARFDHSFERGVEQAKANYTQNPDGTIKVVNTGIKTGISPPLQNAVEPLESLARFSRVSKG